MNSVVTYQDATVAWLLTDDFLSRMSSTVYQRFAGGGHLGGVKVVRGYTEGSKPKEKKAEMYVFSGSDHCLSAAFSLAMPVLDHMCTRIYSSSPVPV